MAQTLNIANIVVGLNAQGGELTRSEIRSVSRVLKESESPASKFATKLDELQRAFRSGGISIEQFVAAEDHLIKKFGVAAQQSEQQAAATRRLTQATRDSSAAFDGQAVSMRSLQMIAGQYIGIAAGFQAIKKSIVLASELENNRIAFEVMTGSASRAETLLKQFKALDVTSPLNYGEFARAGQVLMQFGVDSMQVSGHLNNLAAISLGNTDKFQSLSLAFGQVQAAGRLMGQEVLQMVNSGFNPLQEISRTTGISMAELKKRMEDGQISAKMVADAFASATAEGGLFYGMNERLSQSMAGQWAKLEGDIKAAAITLGTDLMPLLKQTIEMARGGMGGGDGGEDRGILGFNIKLASDAYASLFAGIGAGVEAAAESTRKLDLVFGLGNALSAAVNATLDKSQEIKDAELDREAALIRAANQEGEITKKKADQVIEAKRLADEEMKRVKADNDRVAKINSEIETQKKAFNEMKSLRDQLDKLTMGEDAAKKKKLAEQGLSSQDIARIDTMKKLVDAEGERKKAMQESLDIEKEMMTDKQKAVAEIQKLQALYDGLSVDQKAGTLGQANLAKQEQVRQKFGAGQQTEDIAKNIAPAMRAGSKEAAAFLLNQRADAAEKAERKKWQSDLLAETRKANQINEAAPRLALARN